MSAVALMITSACISFSGNGHEACSKAAEAGAKQSGFEQNVDLMEKNVTQKADKEARILIGTTTFDIVGGTVFIAKTVVDKSVKLNVPTFGLCDKISTQVAPNKYSLHLEWGFK